MDSGATTYNDVMKNFHSTINHLMRPVKRKKIIENVYTHMMNSNKSYKRYSRKESIKKIFNIYSIKNN